MKDTTMGQRIAEGRKKLELSQEALGEKLGVSRQAISKWESDGAVPEIDKLIALSKLFGVTVGWLLGVEEAAPEADTLSEGQIKMVTEIVSRYQPKRPDTSRFRWVFAIPIFAVSLAVLVWAFSWSSRQVRLEVLEQTVVGWHAADVEMISALREQIEELRERVDGQQTPAPTESSLLQSYAFSITPENMGGQAELTLTALPVQWAEGQSAVLSVRHGGEEVVSQTCGWDGAAYTARLRLPVRDGYSYILILKDSGGVQHPQILEDRDVENLLWALTPEITTRQGNWDIDLNIRTLKVWGHGVEVTLPVLACGGPVALERLEGILLLNGREVGRYAYPEPEKLMELYGKEEYLDLSAMSAMELPFPEMGEGDTLTLCLELEFTGCGAYGVVISEWDHHMTLLN